MPSKIRGGLNDKHMADMHNPTPTKMARPQEATPPPPAGTPGELKFNVAANSMLHPAL